MNCSHTPSQVLGFIMQLEDAQYINRAAKRIQAQEMLYCSTDDIPTAADIMSMAVDQPAELDKELDGLIDYAKPQTKRRLRNILKRTIILK